jgi:DNA-binding XRE family transcriptional regulator
MTEQKRNYVAEGEAHYRHYREQLLANPEVAAMYQEEAGKKALWLQLVEARQKMGITQAQMARRLKVSQAQIARIEKRGYDSYTLNTLRRYVAALGGDYVLEVRVRSVDQSMKREPAAPATITP